MRSFVTASIIALGFWACDTVAAGKGATLKFQFDADEALIPAAFSTPVAAGFKVDVLCFGENGKGDPASVNQATSADATVATVVGTSGNVVHLEAHAAGTTEIVVQTSRGEDAFDVTVVAAGKLDVSAPGALIPDSPASKGVVGGAARFSVQFKSGSRLAIGFGTLPITIAPAEAATVDASTEIGYAVVHFAAEGTTTVTGLGDDAISVDVIPQNAVTGLSLKGANPTTLKVDGTTLTVLRGTTDAADTVVGIASLATVVSSNSAVCTVTPNPNIGEGGYTIKGVTAGDCQVDATWGTLTAHLPVTVTP